MPLFYVYTRGSIDVGYPAGIPGIMGHLVESTKREICIEAYYLH